MTGHKDHLGLPGPEAALCVPSCLCCKRKKHSRTQKDPEAPSAPAANQGVRSPRVLLPAPPLRDTRTAVAPHPASWSRADWFGQFVTVVVQLATYRLAANTYPCSLQLS